MFNRAQALLFPKVLKVTETSKRMMKPSRENGGWGDVRDHELCLNNSVVNLAEPVDFLRGSLGDVIGDAVSEPMLHPL